MKKILFYILCLFLLGLGVYFISQGNFLGGLLSFLGVGGRATIEIKRKADELKKEADELKVDIDIIRKKRKDLKVEDKTDDEEVEYWKNQ